jgi:hypothetical protein
LAAEIRGDVSRETLLLSEMPEISIETSRNPHGYNLKAEDIFWCRQGILRTNHLRDSDDEQMMADLIASVVSDGPIQASGDYLDKLYSSDDEIAVELNRRLAAYPRSKLEHEIKTTFSAIREVIESVSLDRFYFRATVYPRPTSNAQKAAFYAVFMAFHDLMFKQGMQPGDLRESWHP